MIINSYYQVERKLIPLLGYCEDLFNLLLRLYIAQIFFRSGLTKLRDWDSTLFLFQDEYQVPLLSPDTAAYLGTSGELLLPILLVVGLFTRFAAVGLFVINLVAAISLPDLSPIALLQHSLWCAGTMYVIFHGGARLSSDFFVQKLPIKK